MNSDSWVHDILDSVSARLVVLEACGVHAAELRVSARAYAAFVDLRDRELADGVPLSVLGIAVVEDPRLAPTDFALTLPAHAPLEDAAAGDWASAVDLLCWTPGL